MNWRHQAACRDHDPELWFSGKPYEQAAALARANHVPYLDVYNAAMSAYECSKGEDGL